MNPPRNHTLTASSCLLFVGLLLISCASPGRPSLDLMTQGPTLQERRAYLEANSDVDGALYRALHAGKAIRGMPPAQVILAKGEPSKRNAPEGSYDEMWLYANGAHSTRVYFENDQVAAIIHSGPKHSGPKQKILPNPF